MDHFQLSTGELHGEDVALSDIVRRFGGNILELESASESAPQSGEPLFRLRMTVRLPPTVESADLWRQLEAAAASQGVDLEVHAAPAPDGDSVVHGPGRRSRRRPS